MSIRGKRILITGASGGLGTACIDLFQEKGANVIGIDKEPSPDHANIVQADVRDEESVGRAVEEAISRLGGLDILINNAGVLSLQDAGANPNGQTEEAFEVNLMGLWRVSAAAIPALKKSGGRIINVASLFAVVNAPFIPGYCASKRAVSAYSDVLRFQIGDKIKVITLYPGYMDTQIHNAALKHGLSVKKLVTFRFFGRKFFSLEESLPAAARGMARACSRRYIRDRGLTFLGSVSLWFARHTPRFVDWFIGKRLNYLIRKGHLTVSLN